MFSLYSHNIWNYYPTDDRNPLIRSLIDDFDADICAFQECSYTSNRVGNFPICELMKDKYTELGPGLYNFTPVFYKAEKFNIIDNGYLLYDGLNDVNSKSVTWAVLEDKIEKNRFAVMSTHFWWKAESEKDNLQRLENARQLKALCDEVVKKYNVPVIIGGDFNNGKNSSQGDEPYHFMLKTGFKDIRLTASETTKKHTHRICKYEEGKKAYAPLIEPCITIDYIFTYGEGILPLKFDVLSSEKALMTSDHCPLTAHFKIIR